MFTIRDTELIYKLFKLWSRLKKKKNSYMFIIITLVKYGLKLKIEKKK